MMAENDSRLLVNLSTWDADGMTQIKFDVLSTNKLIL